MHEGKRTTEVTVATWIQVRSLRVVKTERPTRIEHDRARTTLKATIVRLPWADTKPCEGTPDVTKPVEVKDSSPFPFSVRYMVIQDKMMNERIAVYAGRSWRLDQDTL
jgi:hypothetical protein